MYKGEQIVIQTPKKVLIFAAHQDDETIGCGGTIKKWSDAGSEIHVCFMTDGGTGIDPEHDPYTRHNIKTIRMKEASLAAKVLGIHRIHEFRVKCQTLRNGQLIFHKCISLIRKVKPDLVVTHDKVCKHRDHKATSEIVVEACWKASERLSSELGEVHAVDAVWSFEILDPHPNPDFVVDITDTYGYKMKAMAIYFSQHGILSGIMDYIDGLAKVRGHSVGVKYGEAFTRLGNIPVKL